VIEVALDKLATEAEIDAVRDAFEDAGLSAEVTADLEFRSAFPPWVIDITVLTASLFFGGFAAAAGADAWKGLRGLVMKLFRAREPALGSTGSISVTVTEVHEVIRFSQDLPDLAFRSLVQIEIVQTESGQLQWDPRTRTWRDTLDIARD